MIPNPNYTITIPITKRKATDASFSVTKQAMLLSMKRFLNDAQRKELKYVHQMVDKCRYADQVKLRVRY